MKFAERTFYAFLGAHFAAVLIGREGVEWRTVFYGGFLVATIAGIILTFQWFQSRRANPEDS